MVEVFKTNVTNEQQAEKLILLIRETFPTYKANFDLDDCDNILRVESESGVVSTKQLIFLLKKQGYVTEVLDDVPVSFSPDFKY